MERNQNYVELWGVAAGEPVFSHENHTRRFDKFPLRVERLSGQNDVPVIVASEALLRVCPVEEGQSLRIVGQLRSFNNKSGQGNRLVITVFAQSIEPGDGSYFNRILLSGALCKKPCAAHAARPQHLRRHSGSQPPLRARGLLTLHRLGTDRRADRGHGRRRAIGA